MAPEDPKRHIKIEGYNTSHDYVYPRRVNGGGIDIIQRDRNIHGNSILRQLQEIRQRFQIEDEIDLPENIVKDDAIYVEFISEWGYPLKFDSLESNNRGSLQFQILNIREEKNPENDLIRYRVTLMITQGGVSVFIRKVEAYLTENIRDRAGVDTGNPKNNALLNNISIIQLATLQAFWTDAPEIPFPDENANVWWEVWFRRTANDQTKVAAVLSNLELIGARIGQSELEFAEHRVRLVYGNANQLSQSILLLDNLSELRAPQETSDFILNRDATYSSQAEWLNDLQGRTEAVVDENSVLICLLDSGVNNQHPLISSFLPDERLYTYKPGDWNTVDDWPNGGHGTGVAGLSLYGDLTDVLAQPGQIRILHGLESFKIIHPNVRIEPELYGAVTEYAVSIPIVDRPNSLRVFCLTVTDKGFAFKGRPSAWSAAIDKLAYGSVFNPLFPQLIIISAGNVLILNHDEYPAKNHMESVHDPAQSYNALTVGSYTRKDRIDPATGLSHLAMNGAMAPSNSTSIIWDAQWPIKPDIVMEGGNASSDGTAVSDHYSLKLLSVDREYPAFTFLPFGDTSGAAALASKMAAELRTQYPEFWPETIRALMVHSAEWTPAMLGNRNINLFSERERINLLRTVGYGVPIQEKALYSASNSLTLIAEKEIQPYRLDGSTAKTNEYHLFELPWPADILSDTLFDQDVTLKVTLSYFIEPNPGSRVNRYANNYQYHSHDLDFAVIKPEETLQQFRRRISAETELADNDFDGTEEQWSIKRVRSRGSVKKDFITMSGAALAQRNTIAVYPKKGWYRTRKKLMKVNTNVRYSLVVTLETPNIEIDIYTPVLNQIENLVIV